MTDKTYSPSPRPTFPGPTLVRESEAVRHVWGDPEAGEVDDWIYVSSGLIHCIVFGLQPGRAFRHSPEFRTVFGADELLQVVEGTMVLANPEILSVSGSIVMSEECSSHRDVVVDVARASRVVVAGTVPGSGRSVVIIADAFEARRLLHELDHLDGISMLDRVIDPTTGLRNGTAVDRPRG